MTPDYKRNGTTTLFVALNVLDGTVIGQCMKRHRQFLGQVDRDTPVELNLHLIADNYATHKHPISSSASSVRLPASTQDRHQRS